MVTGIIFIPFNYYLNNTTENSIIETLELPLLKVTTYNKNRCFFYSYNGNYSVYYGYKPIMTNIVNNNNSNDYKVVFKVKKGDFGVFKIINWNLKLKTY